MSEDRWSDNGPECPYCNRRVKTTANNRECSTCARGETAPAKTATKYHPIGGFYPPLRRLSPEQIEAWRVKQEQFDAEQLKESRGEPTTPEPDRYEEYASRK